MAKDEKTILDSEETVLDSDETVLDAKAADATLPDDAATMPDDATVFDGEATSNDGNCAPVIEKGASLLDTYRIESDAIEGGMGAVWRVHHTGWNVDLAMKRPKSSLFQLEKQKENFVHECEAWINLGLHPYIVSCYYVRDINNVPSIFSEWMDGGSLKSAIENGRLYEGNAAERILDIAIQSARGLHYAHEQGLIHQDVKPDNLLLTKDWNAKVADFGIARARATLTVLDADIPTDATMFSASGGYTPAYCSMEQMNGEQLTRRTDIYSWAVSVMEMYLGDRPWQNGVIAGAACEEYFPDAKVTIPQKMQDLLKACLNVKEIERPHNFAEIEKILLEIYQEEAGEKYPRPVSKAAADTADSLNNRALSMLDLGKEAETAAYFDRALSADAHAGNANFNALLYAWRQGKIADDDAIRQIKALYINNVTPQNTLALAKLEIERNDKRTALSLLDGVKNQVEPDEYAQAAAEAASIPDEGLIKSLGYGAAMNHSGTHILYVEDEKLVFSKMDGTAIRSFPVYNTPVYRLYLSDDCRYAISCRMVNNATVDYWDSPAKKEAGMTPKKMSASSTRDPDKAALAVYLWNIEEGRCIKEFPMADTSQQIIDFFMTDQSIFLMRQKRSVVRIEIGSGEIENKVYDGFWDSFQASWNLLKESHTGNGAGGSNPKFSVEHKYSITLCERKSGRILRTYNYPLPDGANNYSFSTSADGKHLIIAGVGLFALPDFSVGTNYMVSRIETVVSRLALEAQYAKVHELAESALAEKNIPAALAALDKVRELSYDQARERTHDLSFKIGKYCLPSGIYAMDEVHILPDQYKLTEAMQSALQARGLSALRGMFDSGGRYVYIRTKDAAFYRYDEETGELTALAGNNAARRYMIRPRDTVTFQREDTSELAGRIQFEHYYKTLTIRDARSGETLRKMETVAGYSMHLDGRYILSENGQWLLIGNQIIRMDYNWEWADTAQRPDSPSERTETMANQACGGALKELKEKSGFWGRLFGKKK